MNGPNDSTDAKMDRLLKAWADKCAADLFDENGLLQAILTSVPPTVPATVPPAVRRHPEIDRSPKGWSVVAVCSAVMILLAALLAIPVSPSSILPPAMGNADVALPAGLSRLWNRTADVFGPQLNWLCDLDGELLLGVDSGTAMISEHDRAYVLLTVRVRDTPADKWSAIGTVRIVCPLGEPMDFASNTAHSGGTIWVQSRPNGRIAASHWLSWEDHPEISGSIETEAAPGESRVVAERIAAGRSIQVVQQVWAPHAG